jgi:hypothetical protein
MDPRPDPEAFPKPYTTDVTIFWDLTWITGGASGSRIATIAPMLLFSLGQAFTSLGTSGQLPTLNPRSNLQVGEKLLPPLIMEFPVLVILT